MSQSVPVMTQNQKSDAAKLSVEELVQEQQLDDEGGEGEKFASQKNGGISAEGAELVRESVRDTMVAIRFSFLLE